MRRFVFATAVLVAAATPACAGVVNPDISVIGQPSIRWTDDSADPARKRPVLDPGEVETNFDAYLNPYARGTFVLSLGNQGMDLEEGCFQLLRGLPGSLEVKSLHPHFDQEGRWS